MKNNGTVLLAGATGYLGRFIAEELIARNISVKLIVRNIDKVADLAASSVTIVKGEVTCRETLGGQFDDVSTVISTVGITRQKEGLSYMDVDYQGNINLLEEAKKAGVKKFIYISVVNGPLHRDLKMLEAKEAFVDALKCSGLDYTVIRPNGFFSDMRDFLRMAEKGRVYLFGNGSQKINPIHGKDLAVVCVDAIESRKTEIAAGGPDILTHNEVGQMALLACGKPINIIHLPHWVRKLTLWAVRTFTAPKTYGPIEFFLTFMAADAIAPRCGGQRLSLFFQKEMDVIKKRSVG